GQVGRMAVASQDGVVRPLAERLAPWLVERTRMLPVDLAFDQVRLTGRLAGVSSAGLVDYRLAEAGPADWVRLWVRHLVLNCVASADIGRESRLFAQQEDIVLGPLEDAAGLLSALTDAYWRGLHHPLHFFPRSGLRYVDAKSNNDAAARREWEGSDFSRGEGANPYYELAFRGSDPLDDAFRALARQVFEPFLAHREKL
ncbi:MAG: exodeoxyribonuclease V subunit gamma, partial [Gammaproteobacteria bacterium]